MSVRLGKIGFIHNRKGPNKVGFIGILQPKIFGCNLNFCTVPSFQLLGNLMRV